MEAFIFLAIGLILGAWLKKDNTVRPERPSFTKSTDEETDYVNIKQAIIYARTQEDLYQTHIDIIIFKSNYTGWRSELCQKKLEDLYQKKETEFKQVLLN